MPAETPVIELLRQHSYFHSIDERLLRELAGQTVRRIYQPEEVVFHRGEPSAGLWLLESGSVKISRVSAEGTEHIAHLLGSGDSFNDVAAVDGGPYPATAIALTLAICWLLPGEMLRRHLRDDLTINHNVIMFLARRARALNDQIEELALYSVLVRLVRFLIEQADSPTLTDPGITRAAIAAHLATTPETVSRTLAKLQEMGCIRFDRHRILIIDEDRLRTLAQL